MLMGGWEQGVVGWGSAYILEKNDHGDSPHLENLIFVDWFVWDNFFIVWVLVVVLFVCLGGELFCCCFTLLYFKL